GAARDRQRRRPAVPNAAASPGRVAVQGAPGNRRRALVVDSAAAAVGRVADEGAARDGEQRHPEVGDTATVENGRVAAEGAVGTGAPPGVEVEDAAGEVGRVTGERAIRDRRRADVVDTAAAAGRIAANGAGGDVECRRGAVVDAAAGAEDGPV